MDINIDRTISGLSFEESREVLCNTLNIDKNFDIQCKDLLIGKHRASLYFIDGFCKDDLMQKILQYWMEKKDRELPRDIKEFTETCIPYGEIEWQRNLNMIVENILSGVNALLVEGYDETILIDSRTYPARTVTEPDKDKVMRGSKDGFVETIVFNTALIRRRIRSTDLHIEMMRVGKSSRTDIAICYMSERVDTDFLNHIKTKISNIEVDSLTLNQESLAECLIDYAWINPFPKMKYSERPDCAAAQILEGNVVILVDNSPSAMILPISLFSVVDEADDYYFPPVTGTYLRISRFIIFLLTYLMTPTFLLLMKHTEWIPAGFYFIVPKETPNIPLIWQFLILELCIDGLKLAAINTPSMLTTPLSIVAALVLGEFSVQSGWFNSEVMLYMAFVAIANYTQANFELGYALKFMRIITLSLTAIWALPGYIAGILIFILCILCNRTVSGDNYVFSRHARMNGQTILNVLVRRRMPDLRKNSKKHVKKRL